MKKLSIIVLSIIMAFLCFAPKLQKSYAASLSDNSVIILSGKANDDGEIDIKVSITKNTGICAMLLELSYDTSVLTLQNVVKGNALSSLDYLTTNTKTELGYSITPFRFSYSGNANDSSTGELFTLKFKLKDGVTNGNFKISLLYNKNQDVNYYDNNGRVKTKNLYIDNAEIELKDNVVVDIKSIKDKDSIKANFPWTTIIICSSVAIVVAGGVVAIIILKKRRNWKRL